MLKRAADELKEPGACHHLGELYLNGEQSMGVMPDEPKGIRYLERAIELSLHPDAAYTLGMFYLSYEGKPNYLCKDPNQKAFSNFNIAHQNGCAAATYQLGRFFEFGILGVETTDPQIAKEYYEKAAQAGNMDANCSLGKIRYKERQGEINYLPDAYKAEMTGDEKCFSACANHDHAEGAFLLAELEYRPRIAFNKELDGSDRRKVNRSTQEFADLTYQYRRRLHQAADGGYLPALTLLENLYRKGEPGFSIFKDEKLADSYLLKIKELRPSKQSIDKKDNCSLM